MKSDATAPMLWLRSNGFILGMIAAVILAFLFPEPGSRGGWLNAELLNNGGIALILFLQGLSLPFDQVKRGINNWRLHGVIQAFTFGVFPLLGLVFHAATKWIWQGEPESIRWGFLYLCVLPSTVSTSVVLTAVARGNTSAALFNAAASNILGVFITPVLVQLLMQRTGQSGPLGPLLLKVVLLTLVPFLAGMLLRPLIHSFVDARKPWVGRISNTVILLIVYTAFCDSVQERIWERHGWLLTVQVIAGVATLFASISLLVYATCRILNLSREDMIAAYFCSVKKTLAMGVPLAVLIFGRREDLSLILLPVLFYHPLQLFANGLLANYWARESNRP